VESALQPNTVLIAIFEFVLLLFSLSVHECAHAWMASRLGDQTARLQGRVTLNPMYHIDPIGTLLFPALMIFGPLFTGGMMGGYLFGWAKPTPVITRNFTHIKRDDILTTLAGPASNLLIVFVAFFAWSIIILVFGHLPQQGDMTTNVQALSILCNLAIQVNLALFFFNLLPIPPLDGSHILRNFLPYNFLNTYDNIGIYGLILMILVGGPIVRFLMGPALGLIYLLLSHIPRA
jgi:Zn-dependent protease